MSTTVQRLTRNTFFSFLSSVTRLTANAVLFILVARFYGPQGFGQFTTAHTLSTVFVLFADFGFDLLLTTELSRNRESISFLLPRMFAVKLIFAFLATLMMCTYALVQPMSMATRNLTLIFSLYLFFFSLLNFVFAIFRAHDEMHHESLITLMFNLALLVCLAILGATGGSLYLVAGAFVCSRVLGLLLGLRKGRRFTLALRPQLDLVWFRSAIKQISVFGIFFVFGSLFFTFDTVLLSIWRGDYDVGIYQAVFRIIALTLVVPEVVVTAVLPSLSQLYVGENDRWRKIGAVASKTLYFAGLLVGVLLFTTADQIVRIIYGRGAFEASVDVMRVFGAIVVVRYAVEVSALMLTTSHRQHIRMILVVGATILNVGLNCWAIPHYGVYGAAVVSLVTNTAVGIGYVIASAGDFRERWFTRQRMLPLCVILGGGALIAIVDVIPVWFLLVSVAVLYCIAVFRIGYTQEERGLILRIAFKGSVS